VRHLSAERALRAKLAEVDRSIEYRINAEEYRASQA